MARTADVPRMTLGVIIILTNIGTRHIGIVFEDEVAGGLQVLHLAFHRQLCRDTVGAFLSFARDGTALVAPLWDVDVVVARPYALYCRRVWEVNKGPQVPYALGYPRGYLDPKAGSQRKAGPGIGLTCATCVMAVLEAKGLDLLRYEDWEARDTEDREDQRLLLRLMCTHKVPVEHIRATAKDRFGPRFRPEEVAYAFVADELPVAFAEAAVAGADVLAQVRRASD